MSVPCANSTMLKPPRLSLGMRRQASDATNFDWTREHEVGNGEIRGLHREGLNKGLDGC